MSLFPKYGRQYISWSVRFKRMSLGMPGKTSANWVRGHLWQQVRHTSCPHGSSLTCCPPCDDTMRPSRLKAMQWTASLYTPVLCGISCLYWVTLCWVSFIESKALLGTKVMRGEWFVSKENTHCTSHSRNKLNLNPRETDMVQQFTVPCIWYHCPGAPSQGCRQDFSHVLSISCWPWLCCWAWVSSEGWTGGWQLYGDKYLIEYGKVFLGLLSLTHVVLAFF